MPSNPLPALILACAAALVPAADNVPLDKHDAEFIATANMCGLSEVRTSELALKRGSLSPDERQFAELMVSDHTGANKELASIAKAKDVPLAQDLDKDSRKAYDSLAGEPDDKFAADYIAAQVSDHKKAVKLFEEESEDGKDRDLKAFATKYLPTLRSHLETAKQLDKRH